MKGRPSRDDGSFPISSPVLQVSSYSRLGIIGIYGLVVAMVLKSKLVKASEGYTLYNGFAHLAAGLTCGLCGLGAGYATGIVGDAGVRGAAQQPRLFVGTILILIFAEVSLSVPVPNAAFRVLV